jgi:tRNA modification GTPase
MSPASGDTIVAIASPPGGGLRGVLRLSGPRALALAAGRLERPQGQPCPTRRAVFEARFDDGVGTQPCLVLWMPGPGSYTREDVVELHLPGAVPLLQAALRVLLGDGARAALAGEFTRRAFENGRLDLTRAEGVLELIEATDAAEQRAAAALLRGGLAGRVEALRGGLDDLRALAEASLDFDEDDTGHVDAEVLERGFERADERLAEALAWEVARPAARSLPRVGLVGAPNAGKSTLFNALTGSDAALVADRRGTTRDTLEATWTLGAADAGGPARVELLDFPGLDAAAAGTDAAAQERAHELLGGLDLLLWVIDARQGVCAAEGERVEQLAGGRPRIALWNQVDRGPAAPAPADRALLEELPWVPTGCGPAGTVGLDTLARHLRAALGGRAHSVARELSGRHAAALADARSALGRARATWSAGQPLDLVAVELRGAVDALDDVLGRTSPEDLLDRIFSRFCIGK